MSNVPVEHDTVKQWLFPLNSSVYLNCPNRELNMSSVVEKLYNEKMLFGSQYCLVV